MLPNKNGGVNLNATVKIKDSIQEKAVYYFIGKDLDCFSQLYQDQQDGNIRKVVDNDRGWRPILPGLNDVSKRCDSLGSGWLYLKGYRTIWLLRLRTVLENAPVKY